MQSLSFVLVHFTRFEFANLRNWIQEVLLRDVRRSTCRTCSSSPTFTSWTPCQQTLRNFFIFKTCSFMVLIKEGNSELVAQARKKKSIFDCSRFDKKKLQRFLLRAQLFPSNISNMCSFMLAFIFCYDLFWYVLVLIWEMQVHFANSNYFLICSKISKAYLLVQKKSYAEFLIINISSDLFCARWFDAYFQVPLEWLWFLLLLKRSTLSP